jgi:hypothetical protein
VESADGVVADTLRDPAFELLNIGENSRQRIPHRALSSSETDYTAQMPSFVGAFANERTTRVSFACRDLVRLSGADCTFWNISSVPSCCALRFVDNLHRSELLHHLLKEYEIKIEAIMNANLNYQCRSQCDPSRQLRNYRRRNRY